GSAVTLDDYRTIGYDLGTTQGAYAAGAATLPADEWLSRDWLRGWIGACARFLDVLREDDALNDARLAPLRPLRDRVLALWAARGRVRRRRRRCREVLRRGRRRALLVDGRGDRTDRTTTRHRRGTGGAVRPVVRRPGDRPGAGDRTCRVAG